MHRFLRPLLALGLIAFASGAQAATLNDIKASWIDAKYHTASKSEQEKKLNALAVEAKAVTAQTGDAEAKVWEAVVLATRAKLIGGTSALDDVRGAKNLLDAAIPATPPSVNNGYAHALLGGLYGKVPGWPISFGDNGKARENFKKSMALGPNNIDVMYIYAEFLAEHDKDAEARAMLEKALTVPVRTGLEEADAGRREEISALLATLR